MTDHRSFLKHLSKALPVIVSVSLLTFILVHGGLLRGFETASLDIGLNFKTPPSARHVYLVTINNEEYNDQELFRGASPLDPQKLRQIIAAVVAGQPAVIGVDIETSSPVFTGLNPDPSWPPVVWARDAIQREEIFEPQPVLGEKQPTALSGLAIMPRDGDGIVRRYRRMYPVLAPPLLDRHPAFPSAVIAAYETSTSEAGKRGYTRYLEQAKQEDLILNLAGQRYYIPIISVKNLLTASKGEDWRTKGPLKGKIVLVGGTYRAARDTHVTPVGEMQGAELLAQTVEAELQGNGIHLANELAMLLLEFATGFALVWLHYRFHQKVKLALLLSLVAIPALALIGSLIAFSAFSMWASFIPILTATLIHQLYDHIQEYRKMYKPFHTDGNA